MIGVLAAAYTGARVGSRLLGELELWVAEHGIHWLKLTATAHDQRIGTTSTSSLARCHECEESLIVEAIPDLAR